MRNYLPILAVIIFVATILACRSTKKIQTAITKKDTAQIISVGNPKVDSAKFIREVYATIQRNRIDFRTFSAKIKVDFEGKDGKRNDFNAFVRIKKDSLLWISINAALGIEAFRILVTPDSVKVLNKLEKVAQLRSVEYLQEVASLPITFSELQDLIVGNPVYLDSNIVSYKIGEKEISLISVGHMFKHMLTVSNNEYTLENSKLDDIDVIRARTSLILYGDYETRNNIRFSRFRKITITEKNKLDIEMQFRQFNFNEELNFPFNIPRNYKLQ